MFAFFLVHIHNVFRGCIIYNILFLFNGYLPSICILHIYIYRHVLAIYLFAMEILQG